MLYKKNTKAHLDDALFRNPSSEYRGTPFWAWNCDLEKDELCRQIDIFKEMGLGGFHMHVRTGLSTPYLSDEYMDIIKCCVEKAKKENMLAWLYDEDRWPSGFAGGLVTENPEYRSRSLVFSNQSYDEIYAHRAKDGSKFIASYDVKLDDEGFLSSYKRIDKEMTAEGDKWYAYLVVAEPWSRYNNQTYVDTLNKKAIEKFIEVTHERYKETVGADFGDDVPAIFTDEPQFKRKGTFNNSTDKDNVTLPWTDDLPETYKETYGEDILDSLPELFWDLKDSKVSVNRYRYHDHLAERFSCAFADTVGAWCRKNGIALTGHMMEEPWLKSQTAALGEAMRSYRGFDLPGIDMLCNRYEFTTAKQAQSAAHQFGSEGVLSELYGVTGWDYDFRGHKLQGDWQAALGITIRVQHLSWASMAGEAKRDYPASIHYQSPWYKEYSYIEDHFARVNTALTRGKPIVKVGVIHPVESYWLHWGPNDKSDLIRETMDKKFKDITEWLLKGSIDFNFICESLLPSLCDKGSNPLKVGEMQYDAIVVPDCETLRSSTLERLEQFRNQGGKLIFMGNAPEYENAVESDRGRKLYEKSISVSFDRARLLDALESNRTVTLRYNDGKLTDDFIYQLRADNDCEWLFISHCCEPYNKDVFRSKNLRITLSGEKKVTVYDTLTGETYPADTDYASGNTIIKKKMYDYDSLLLKIEDGKNEIVSAENEKELVYVKTSSEVPYTLDEKNVLLLDMCQFSVDDGEFMPEEEILRADNTARKITGLKERNGSVAQPWVIQPEEPKHTITLRFAVDALVDIKNPILALEDAEKAEITLNGKSVSNDVTGWYVDKAIKTVKLPDMYKGENIITVKLPLGNRTNTEWCYLLGDFGVRVTGRKVQLTDLPEKLWFGDIVNQGLAFYGGNITYHMGDINCDNGEVEIAVPHYRGALVKVLVDGEDKGNIVFSPNTIRVKGLTEGVHKLDIKLYTHRFNSFGSVHNADAALSWHGPDSWRTKDEIWTYEYRLKAVGVLSTPIIKA
jgi:hypothetical protein